MGGEHVEQQARQTQTAAPAGYRVKIIAGTIDGVTGPVDDIVIGGSGTTGGTEIENGTLVLFGNDPRVSVSVSDEGIRFLLLSGRPLNGPVAWRDPG